MMTESLLSNVTANVGGTAKFTATVPSDKNVQWFVGKYASFFTKLFIESREQNPSKNGDFF